MMRGIIPCSLLLALGGCGGVIAAPVALQVLSGIASAATIADKVLDIDVSLSQAKQDKIPIGRGLMGLVP